MNSKIGHKKYYSNISSNSVRSSSSTSRRPIFWLDSSFFHLYTCFLQEAGFKPNVQVFSALIGRATRRLDYIYLKTILKSMSSMEVWPNEVIIRQLEFASQYPPNYNQVSIPTVHEGTRASPAVQTGQCIPEHDPVNKYLCGCLGEDRLELNIRPARWPEQNFCFTCE